MRAFFTLEEANDVLAKIKQKHAYKQTPEYIQEEEDKRQILLAKQRVRNRIVEKAKSKIDRRKSCRPNSSEKVKIAVFRITK